VAKVSSTRTTVVAGTRPGSTPAARRSTSHSRRWLAAAVLIGAALMDMIDVTIVNVALPSIRSDLGASSTQLAWMLSGYMLAFAAALIVAGSFGDLLGRKRVFLIGVALFGAASLAAGLARTPDQLITARVAQGAAAAAMIPQVLATFRAMFTGKERGQAFGMYGAVLGFASALGLVLGGVLTDADLFGWGWRTVFFINVPIALVSLVAGARLVPETRDRLAGRPDVIGAAHLTVALVAIAYPLLEGRNLGWPVWLWPVLAGGFATLVGLWVVEDRRDHARVAPLLRTRVFRIPAFGAGLTVQFAFAAGLQGFFLVFALWLQAGMGFSPLAAGLTTVAFSVGSFALAPVAVALAQRYGRLVLACGGLLLALGIVGVALGASSVGTGVNPWPIVPGLVIAGAGLSLLVIPLVNVVLAAVPVGAAGGASGLFSTAQQFGGAVGIAVVGTAFFARLGSRSVTEAFTQCLPIAAGLFLVAAVLALLLPRTALTEDEMF
jgi:EmrB/QacA subfamily drug resistance transporter